MQPRVSGSIWLLFSAHAQLELQNVNAHFTFQLTETVPIHVYVPFDHSALQCVRMKAKRKSHQGLKEKQQQQQQCNPCSDNLVNNNAVIPKRSVTTAPYNVANLYFSLLLAA